VECFSRLVLDGFSRGQGGKTVAVKVEYSEKFLFQNIFNLSLHIFLSVCHIGISGSLR